MFKNTNVQMTKDAKYTLTETKMKGNTTGIV